MGIASRLAAVARYSRAVLGFGANTAAQDPTEQRIAASADFFRRLKNRYTGRRGFVIGNGPSLKVADLERLADEISIASNKVYLAYAETRWRPTLFTIADPLVWEKVRGALGTYQPQVLIPSYLDVPGDIGVDVKMFRDLGNAADAATDSFGQTVYFSSDASQGLYGGYTVTYENLQLAVHLGLNPIYLIGCDHYYAGESNVIKDSPVMTGESQNHFLPGYRAPGEVVNPAPIAEMTRSYEYAQRFAGQNGIRIVNATRGGYLEVFPRASFDALF